MEKLIQYLNERTGTDWWYQEVFEWHFAFSDNTLENVPVTDVYLICKRYWFIKWLVEHDKIDTDIVYRMWFLCKTYDKDEVWEYFEPYEEILMLLSIQENPIEFLVSILK